MRNVILGLSKAALVFGMLISLGSCGGSDSQSTPEPPVVTPAPTPTPTPAPPPVTPRCQEIIPSALERSLADRPDDVEGAQLHFVYAIPADGNNSEIDINGQLIDEYTVAQQWLFEQTGRCMRVDTYDGYLDITFMQTTRDNEAIRTDPLSVYYSIKLELEARGMDSPNKVYVVYYGGTTYTNGCGGAAAIGGPAMQYLVTRNIGSSQLNPCPFFSFVNGPNGTFRGSWSGVSIHETFHSLGVVPFCAPDHDDVNPLHLRTISSDLMAFDGSGFTTYTLDRNRNQYYDHQIQGCLDLADSAIWTDAEANAEPLPNKAVYNDTELLSCEEESVVSFVEGDPVNIRFVNMRSTPVNLIPLDEMGARLNPIFVPAYQESFSVSNEGAYYVATTKEVTQCISLHKVVDGENRILLID